MTGLDDVLITLAESRRIKVAGQRCRLCPARRNLEAHHIVHRSKMPHGKRNPLLHHPDNLMPLCHQHHQDHHTTAHRRVPRSALTPAELAFALEHANPGWVDLWYPITTGAAGTM